MKTSGAIDQIADALAKAQGVIQSPTRNKKVKVSTRGGGDYEFLYADLHGIIEAVKKPLSENGLSYTQTLEQDDHGKFRLETTLMHASGQFISSTTPIMVDRDGNQGFGSALTFMKRYALAAILGVAADSDDDANAADGNSAKVEDRTVKKSPIVAPAPLTHMPPASLKVNKDGAGVFDWVAFGTEFSQAIRASKSTGELDDWVTLNGSALADMERDVPKVRKRVSQVISEMYTKLGDQSA